MAFAADQVRVSAQSNARSGSVVRFIWHHQAGTNDDATINAMVSGSRQVSATWTVSNTGRVTAVVPEDRRPWTSASRADDGALTVECANSTGPDDYGISDASHEACARLAAYAFRAHGVPLQRATAANGWRGHMGHNEVVGAFGDGYSTACPLHLDIDRILTLARDAGPGVGGGALQPTTPPAEEDEMAALGDAIKIIQPDDSFRNGATYILGVQGWSWQSGQDEAFALQQGLFKPNQPRPVGAGEADFLFRRDGVHLDINGARGNI